MRCFTGFDQLFRFFSHPIDQTRHFHLHHDFYRGFPMLQKDRGWIENADHAAVD